MRNVAMAAKLMIITLVSKYTFFYKHKSFIILFYKSFYKNK